MAGGAVVQTLGAEMGRDQWSWLHERMHGQLAGAVVRDSAAAVQQVGAGRGWEGMGAPYVARGQACERASPALLAHLKRPHPPTRPHYTHAGAAGVLRPD